MKPELKAKWVAALRSGEYTQARETLCDEGDAFCCLGVLLSISDKGYWNGPLYEFEREYDDDGDPIVCDGDLGRFGRRMFGISDTAEASLITMNDDQNKSFAEIADYIESAL